MALAGGADRPAHQLRRRTARICARSPTARASASTTSRARTRRTRSCCYQNTLDTHEFFIWEDPKNPKRALLFAASAGSRLQIYDLSPRAQGPRPGGAGRGEGAGPDARHAHGFGNSNGSGIHSFSVSNDGKRGYFALLTRGFGVVDFTDFTDNDPATNTYRTITPTANRPTWPGPGAHSAVKLWNQDWVYVSDEVYGTITGGGHGCPWGWTRFVDIADETRPVVRSDFRLAENQPLSCTNVQPAAHVLLRPQPDADAEHRLQHLALGRLPGDGHHQPDERHPAGGVQADAAADWSATEDPRLSDDDLDPATAPTRRS